MVAGGRLDACPNFNIIGSARAAYSRPFAPAAALLFTALLFEETDSMSDIDMTGVDIIVVGAGNAATFTTFALSPSTPTGGSRR